MTMVFVMSGFMFVVIMAFIVGMLFLPELFGISKPQQDNLTSDETKMEK